MFPKASNGAILEDVPLSFPLNTETATLFDLKNKTVFDIGDSPEKWQPNTSPNPTKTFLIWSIPCFVSLLLFMLVIVGLSNNWSVFDETLVSVLHVRFFWSFTFLVISIICFIGVSLVIISKILFRRYDFNLWQKILLGLCFGVSFVGTIVMSFYSRGIFTGVTLFIIFFFPFVPSGLLFLSSVLLTLVAIFNHSVHKKLIIKVNTEHMKLLRFCLVFIVLIILTIVLTYVIASPNPCITNEPLGTKPAIISHRGAPHEGPENTMESVKNTVDINLIGIETDVVLSFDGIPFLMHDSTFYRTTDIGKVFPKQKHDHCSTFEWEKIEKLKANQWGKLDDFKLDWKKEYPNAPVPKFSELINYTQEHDLILIFDFRQPHPSSEYFHNFPSYLFDFLKIQYANHPNLLWWLYDFDSNYNKSAAAEAEELFHRAKAAHFNLTCGLKSSKLRNLDELKDCDVINIDIGALLRKPAIKQYQTNHWLNIYVVDTKWMFSLCWCSGAHSVTTNNARVLSQMNAPSMFMTTGTFVRYCLIFYLGSITLFVFTLIYFKSLSNQLTKIVQM